MSVVSSRVILKYLYYNNYTGKPSYGSDIASLGISLAINNTGRLTWIKTKALDYESGMDYWLEQTIYYDRYGRVVQEVQDNHLNGVDYITNKYDFTGQVIQTRYRHTADGTTTYTDQYNDYDHRGRIIKERHRINGGNELLLAGSNYNEAGELVDKYLHSVSGGTFLQRNDYLYNVRGWLTEINSPATFSENDQFGLKLYYNSAPTGGAAKYNGNISGMGWGSVANSNMLYRFSYDGNNRLSSADFYKSGIATNGFDANYTYDKNGNIKTLNRYSIAGSYIDQLTYQYSGNKITGLKDDSGDIANTVDYPGSTSTLSFNYDNNGNVTGEPHKQITLDYNLINLPRAINLNGQNRYIYYYYTFDGEKLRKTVENNGVITKTDYCGPFVYETVSGTRSLKYIITSEGRAVKNGSSWDYEYNLKDHLGNVRVVIHKNSSDVAEPIQERHYYPYGMEMSSLSTGSSSNKYFYNGKELQDGLNLDWYDYGARFYDPQIGRFTTIDPLAEKYHSISTFAYCFNNPIRFIDPDGRSATNYEDEEGKRLLTTNDGNNSTITVKKDQMGKFINGVHEMALNRTLDDKQSNVNLIDAVTPATDGVFFTDKQMAWMYMNINNIENVAWTTQGGVVVEPTEGKSIVSGQYEKNTASSSDVYLGQKANGSSLSITLNGKDYPVNSFVHDHPFITGGMNDNVNVFSGTAWKYPNGNKYYSGDIGFYQGYKDRGVNFNMYLIGPRDVVQYTNQKVNNVVGRTSDLLKGQNLIR